VYLPFNEVDIIGEDIIETENTKVLDSKGKVIGSLKDFPDATKTGQVDKDGKDIYVVTDETKTTKEPETRPKWLTFGLWSLVVLGSLTFIVVIAKALSK